MVNDSDRCRCPDLAYFSSLNVQMLLLLAVLLCCCDAGPAAVVVADNAVLTSLRSAMITGEACLPNLLRRSTLITGSLLD